MVNDHEIQIDTNYPCCFFLLGGSSLTAAKYKFDYDLISDIRKTYVLLYKFRLYYHAHASAYFRSWKNGSGRHFRFAGIAGQRLQDPHPQKRLKTLRRGPRRTASRGQKPLIPDGSPLSAEKPPSTPEELKTIARRPFRILPTSGRSISFTRFADGSYGKFGFQLRMVKPADMKRYSDSFNIYKLMVKMIEMMGQKAYPDSGNTSLPATGKTWKSRWINYGSLIHRMSILADHKGKKYFKYSQKHAFRMTYRVTARKNGRIHILGTARPYVGIGMSMKIKRITRNIVIRSSNGQVISDRFQMSAKNSDNLGWTFRGRLRLL